MIELSERYAQMGAGRKMHLVAEFGPNRVAAIARCGATPRPSRGNWELTSNVSWGCASQNCRRSRPRNRVTFAG